MTVGAVTRQFQEEQRRAASQAAAQVLASWRMIDTDNIIESWADALPTVTARVAEAQRSAASAGAAYTGKVVSAQGAEPQPAGRVSVSQLAGVASDGRPLDTLLALPARQTVRRIGDGMTASEALAIGRRRVGMLAVTQVADAGRQASSIAMAADRAVGGYRRQISPPACSRCAILAGAFYRWNAGFQRHPSCQCVHVPAVGPKADLDGLETFDPKAYFNSLDRAEQDRVFTAAGAEAIRDGANIGQVVNARRGMTSTTAYGRTVSSTRTGMSRRQSSARRAIRATDQREGLGAIRLMPEQIYLDANGNRDEAIRLLARFGYLEG